MLSNKNLSISNIAQFTFLASSLALFMLLTSLPSNEVEVAPMVNNELSEVRSKILGKYIDDGYIKTDFGSYDLTVDLVSKEIIVVTTGTVSPLDYGFNLYFSSYSETIIPLLERLSMLENIHLGSIK